MTARAGALPETDLSAYFRKFGRVCQSQQLGSLHWLTLAYLSDQFEHYAEISIILMLNFILGLIQKDKGTGGGG